MDNLSNKEGASKILTKEGKTLEKISSLLLVIQLGTFFNFVNIINLDKLTNSLIN